jgi:hypothetical protein
VTSPAVQSTLPLDPSADDLPAQGSELPGLTGIVPVLDEEQNLEACIASFAEICDEIIVVDSGSTDAPSRSRAASPIASTCGLGRLPDLPQVRDAARATAGS